MLILACSFHQRDKGLLYTTQFAQIALVVTERAALEDMRARGLVQRDTVFSGRSLGEYSALASIADVLPTSALVDDSMSCSIVASRCSALSSAMLLGAPTTRCALSTRVVSTRASQMQRSARSSTLLRCAATSSLISSL